MTSHVIYHDFQTANALVYEPEPQVILTGRMPTKGRRFLRATAYAQAAINIACICFSGACTALSLLLLLTLAMGG